MKLLNKLLKLFITLICLCTIVICVTILPFYLGVFTDYVFNLEYTDDNPMLCWSFGFIEIIIGNHLIL